MIFKKVSNSFEIMLGRFGVYVTLDFLCSMTFGKRIEGGSCTGEAVASRYLLKIEIEIEIGILDVHDSSICSALSNTSHGLSPIHPF